MIINEDVYLEHYGVKGQKWGVRNNKSKTPLTAAQRRKRNTRIVKAVNYALVAVWVASFFSSTSSSTSNSGGGSYKQATKMPPQKAKSASDFINDRRNVEVASLKRMHKEGKMDSQQAEKFLKILNDRYDRKVAAVA